MSKIVDWGHWVVGVLFTVSGAAWLWDSIARLPAVFREHPTDITYRFVSDALIWLTILICAWGIFKWRRWARPLGVVWSAFWVVTISVGFSTRVQSDLRSNLNWLLLVLIGCSVLVWFFLPAVRSEYSRRNQVA